MELRTQILKQWFDRRVGNWHLDLWYCIHFMNSAWCLLKILDINWSKIEKYINVLLKIRNITQIKKNVAITVLLILAYLGGTFVCVVLGLELRA
jgi:hypothetical protein